MQTLASHQDIVVQQRIDLDIIIIRWMADSNVSAIKFIYLSVIDYCVRSQCRRVLIDLRRRSQYCEQIAKWFYTEYMDMVLRMLGDKVKISFIVSPDKCKLVHTIEIKTNKIGIFDTEQEAINWLNE